MVNIARFLFVTVVSVVGFAVSYNFGPDIGITYICILVSWFHLLNIKSFQVVRDILLKSHTQDWE